MNERDKAEELLMLALRSLTCSAEIVVRPDGNRKRESVFQWPAPTWPGPRARSAPEAAPAAQARVAGAEYEKATWPSAGTFLLDRRQLIVFRLLADAYQEGTFEVSQATLLREAGSDARRLKDLFTGPAAAAWGVLVIAGRTPGNYRLPDLPSE